MIQESISKLMEKKDLTEKEAIETMTEIMSGKATDAQIAGFLVALRNKGETIEEITACAKVMREKAINIHPKVENLLDIVGTGGDKSCSINISTISSFVVAGCGVHVAKHGNKSVSSKCGAADVLSSLGADITITPEKIEKCIEEVGIGFMFAPTFHIAMKHAINARKELGVRTIFNILGPMTNPANAKFELMGVYDEKLTEPLAKVLGNLGLKHALVVHGSGLDEITISGSTKVSELKDGKVTTYYIKPQYYGIKSSDMNNLVGGTPEINKEIFLNILNGKEKGPKRDVVILNSAAALYVSDKVKDIKDGIKMAEDSIDNGFALEKLKRFIEFTKKCK